MSWSDNVIFLPSSRIRSIALTDFQEWGATPEGVRNAVLADQVVGPREFIAPIPLPPEIVALSPDIYDVTAIASLCREAITAGRLIDFGAWTNVAVKAGGTRGGPLYTRGVLGHPFRKPWMFLHRWDVAPGHEATSVYLVNPLERDRPAGDCECVEMNPVQNAGEKMLLIGDRILMQPARNVEAQVWTKYFCASIPAPWRYLPGAGQIHGDTDPAHAAAGNVLDPLMTALLILGTRGIIRDHVEVSEKLQKARAKARKPLIPPHERVDSGLYVTALAVRRANARGVSRGGTHASPVVHERIGHPRTYADGTVVLIPDALVNATAEARQNWEMMRRRSHYEMRMG